MYIFRIQSHLVFFRLLILTFFSTYFMFCNLFKLNRGLNMFLIRAVFSLSHHPSFFYRFLLIQICLSTGGLVCRHKSHLFSKLAYSQGSLRAPCHRVSRLLSRMSSGHSHSFVDGKTWLLQMPDAPISYRWKVTTEQKRHRLSPWEHHPKDRPRLRWSLDVQENHKGPTLQCSASAGCAPDVGCARNPQMVGGTHSKQFVCDSLLVC